MHICKFQNEVSGIIAAGIRRSIITNGIHCMLFALFDGTLVGIMAEIVAGMAADATVGTPINTRNNLTGG